ncbi:hypothetical protein PMIN07_006695 [Paraphaeosphaeria minitans]
MQGSECAGEAGLGRVGFALHVPPAQQNGFAAERRDSRAKHAVAEERRRLTEVCLAGRWHLTLGARASRKEAELVVAWTCWVEVARAWPEPVASSVANCLRLVDHDTSTQHSSLLLASSSPSTRRRYAHRRLRLCHRARSPSPPPDCTARRIRVCTSPSASLGWPPLPSRAVLRDTACAVPQARPPHQSSA